MKPRKHDMQDVAEAQAAARRTRMNPWLPTTEPVLLRRYGKATEECGELVAVIGRCVIQGIGGVDPASGKTNRQRLLEELADVHAQSLLLIQALDLEEGSFTQRVQQKLALMAEWEEAIRSAVR